jgi:hypothetical protein
MLAIDVTDEVVVEVVVGAAVDVVVVVVVLADPMHRRVQGRSSNPAAVLRRQSSKHRTVEFS